MPRRPRKPRVEPTPAPPTRRARGERDPAVQARDRAILERMRRVVGGLSNREIGERTRTNPETVRRYLTRGRPSLDFFIELCTTLGIEYKWLVDGTGPDQLSQATPSGTSTPPPTARPTGPGGPAASDAATDRVPEIVTDPIRKQQAQDPCCD